MKTVKKQPVDLNTWDKKPAFEDQAVIEVKVEHSNKMKLMMHTEIATGEHDGKKFRFIMSVCGGGFKLEYDNRCLTLGTRDLVNALMTKIENLNALKDGQMTKKKGKSK